MFNVFNKYVYDISVARHTDIIIIFFKYQIYVICVNSKKAYEYHFTEIYNVRLY